MPRRPSKRTTETRRVPWKCCRCVAKCLVAAPNTHHIPLKPPHPSAPVQLDLSSAESIRKAADALQGRPIHTLINNAGVMGPPERVPSELQGLERQLAVNHMGHFLLTGLLLPNLRASTPARVINVSSNASDFGNLVMGDLGWDPAKRKFSYW